MTGPCVRLQGCHHDRFTPAPDSAGALETSRGETQMWPGVADVVVPGELSSEKGPLGTKVWERAALHREVCKGQE